MYVANADSDNVSVIDTKTKTDTDQPNFTPYTAVIPTQSLDEKNPVDAPLAALSATFDFSKEDLAPTEQLNDIIWKSVNGADSESPAPKTNFRTVRVGWALPTNAKIGPISQWWAMPTLQK